MSVEFHFIVTAENFSDVTKAVKRDQKLYAINILRRQYYIRQLNLTLT